MDILIAEDEKASRMILERYISRWGHTAVECEDGAEAWEVLNGDNPPRIAVVDWVMPNMTGVELCKKLHGRKNREFIYTILLTSKSEEDDIDIALESGIHDILNKPLEPNRLQNRIQVAERILDYENQLLEKSNQLEKYSTEMESLAESRAKALVHADRMTTLGIMSAGIAHEINNPNSFISGNTQTLKNFWTELDPLIKQSIESEPENSSKLSFIHEETPKLLEGTLNGVKRITSIVKSLKTFARQDNSDRKASNVTTIIEESVELCHIKLKNKVDLIQNIPDSLPPIFAAPQQVSQVIINLLVNAADAIEEAANKGSKGTIHLGTSHDDSNITITIRDNGPGIPQDLLDTIWNPFFTTKEVGKGTGLGLSISKSIIEDHNGTLDVTNQSDGGAQFAITLPIYNKNEKES